MPITDMAHAYLKRLHDDPAASFFAFPKALEQLKLDYFPDSLGHIDALLQQIRLKLKPTFGEFMREQKNQNFLYALSFYTGTLVARYKRQKCEWYTYAEFASRLTPEQARNYPDCFGTSMVCSFEDGTACFPLWVIQAVLFEENSGQSLLRSANEMTRRETETTLLRASMTSTASKTGTAQSFYDAGYFGGFLAAFSIYTCVQAGVQLSPQISREKRNGEKLIVNLMYEDFNQAIDIGKDMLDTNAEWDRRMALIYDGFANLPNFRTDALVVELRSHKERIASSIVIPYRPANHSSGFALYDPRLLTFSGTPSDIAPLASGFFAAMTEFKPGIDWPGHYVDENSAENLRSVMMAA